MKYPKNKSQVILIPIYFIFLVITFCGTYFFSKHLFSADYIPTSALTASSVLATKNVTTSKQIVSKDTGIISSSLGFSIKYPYKKVSAMLGYDGVFQASIFFPPSIISLSTTLEESLIRDINNIGLDAWTTILVIEDNTAKTNFKSWIKAYLTKSENQYEENEKILSENTTPTTFAGMKGYIVTRSIEGSKDQNSPHYSRKEIFINKGKYVYRINTIAPSSDTTFPRSGLVGKKYLQRVDTFSTEILKTFSFDGSTKTAITIPKISAPKLFGEANIRREKLLSVLRKEPFFDNNTNYEDPRDKCVSGISASNSNDVSKKNMDLSQAIYVSVEDEKTAEIHAYDKNGGHTGLVPIIPLSSDSIEGNGFAEERAKGVRFDSYGVKSYLSIRENIDGKIEIIGKKYSIAQFQINGEGNSCGIVDISFPVTPYSVATLPMTAQGDLGPISYDIDGDGKQDFELSLLHPLLPEKEQQLYAVIQDMQETK